MTKVHHINCGWLHAPPHPKVCCHCLLLQDPRGVALIDTGIGLQDVKDPQRRIGRQLIELAGFQFNEADTAVRQVERLGLRPADVSDIVLTHCDPDHAGGVADFPTARVHVSREEHAAAFAGHVRYLPVQFEHRPRWVTHGPSDQRWFGLEGRPVPLGFGLEVLLVPLFGHTAGHCGVAVSQGNGWLLHVGDAYYLRAEVERDDHPVSQVSAARATDDAARRASLQQVRRLAREHGGEVEMFGYHDTSEFPGGAAR